jgi:hypothetical protein
MRVKYDFNKKFKILAKKYIFETEDNVPAGKL